MSNFGWTELFTNDLDESVRFYSALFPYAFTEQSYRGQPYLLFSNENGHQGGFTLLAQDGLESLPSHWLSTLVVPSLSALEAALNENQILSKNTMQDDGPEFILFESPNGAITKAVEQNIRISDARSPGAVIWNELLTPNTATSIEFWKKSTNWNSESVLLWPSSNYTLFSNDAGNTAGLQEIHSQLSEKAFWLNFFACADIHRTRSILIANGGQLLTDVITLPQFGAFCVATDNQGATFALNELR